jgi:bifunctional oligoribonuclease and PAP phosphatase NrnA
MLQQILGTIEQKQRFLLTSHARPDGDAVGSLLALYQVLLQRGKQAVPVLSDPVPLLYKGLPFADRIAHTSSVQQDYDAAIILECDSLQRSRVAGLERLFVINIDHHSTGKQFAQMNWIDPAACAVGEMVYRLALASGAKITPQIATCLYTAVLTDTGSFSYAGTNDRTFELAQQLVRFGADPVQIAQSIYFSSPTSKMRLLGYALNNLHREGELAWMYVTQHDVERSGGIEEDLEGLVNYAVGIAGVEVAAFFRELPNQRFRVSLRSKGAIDVARIAEIFGGGGHKCASGFSIDGPLSVAANRVLAHVRIHHSGNGQGERIPADL